MPKKIGNIKLFNIMELSKNLQVTPITLRSYIKHGKLRGQKVGGKWYVTEESLREFFNASRTEEKAQREFFK